MCIPRLSDEVNVYLHSVRPMKTVAITSVLVRSEQGRLPKLLTGRSKRYCLRYKPAARLYVIAASRLCWEDSHGFNSLEGVHLVRAHHCSRAAVYGRTHGASELQPDPRRLRQPHQAANFLSSLRPCHRTQ